MARLREEIVEEFIVQEDVTMKLLTSFKDLIGSGALSPGCKLPPERKLAQQFGISRPSLRQALKVLNIMGVLSQKVGDGTYLNQDASMILKEPLEFLLLLDGISHHELFEARLMVEPELAARAAERATSADLATLHRTIASVAKCANDQNSFIEHDVVFHGAIARAAGNRIFQMLFSVIHRALLKSVARTSRFVDIEHTVSLHRAIYSAIYNRRPEAARQAMRNHLLDARSVLERAIQTGKILNLDDVERIERAQRGGNGKKA
jgi:GntR family transcriptional repressor for pyruvate dehydrogenase complex